MVVSHFIHPACNGVPQAVDCIAGSAERSGSVGLAEYVGYLLRQNNPAIDLAPWANPPSPRR